MRTAILVLSSLVLVGTLPARAEPPAEKKPGQTRVRDEAEKARLLGDHPFTLQWIGWDRPGEVRVVEREGTLYIEGDQRGPKGNFVTIRGRAVEVRKRAFVFEGRIDIALDWMQNGDPCVRTGRMVFRRTGKRRYWRLQQMQSPCAGHVDYVDVYLRRGE